MWRSEDQDIHCKIVSVTQDNESTPVTSQHELFHCKPKTTWGYLCDWMDVVTLDNMQVTFPSLICGF